MKDAREFDVQPNIQTVKLYTADGCYIRKTTKVTLPGFTVVFMDLMSKREALKQALMLRDLEKSSQPREEGKAK